MARRDPWLFIGLLAFFGLVFLALFGERLAPHEAIYFVPKHGDDPRPSSSRELDGDALKLTTAHGDLNRHWIYAEKASARHETTRTTASASVYRSSLHSSSSRPSS
jgi:hypothetical protein